MTSAQQVEALRRDEFNIDLLSVPWSSIKGEFATRIIKRVPMAVIVPADQTLASRSSVKLANIQNEFLSAFMKINLPDAESPLRRIRETRISSNYLRILRYMEEGPIETPISLLRRYHD